LAQEWGSKIHVNSLALGPTMTEGFRTFVLGEDVKDEDYFKNVPIQPVTSGRGSMSW
jgi:hypothetical protein